MKKITVNVKLTGSVLMRNKSFGSHGRGCDCGRVVPGGGGRDRGRRSGRRSILQAILELADLSRISSLEGLFIHRGFSVLAVNQCRNIFKKLPGAGECTIAGRGIAGRM